MSRPAVVYLVMIVALVAGLWAVLGLGRHLHAPEDLAGKWQLTPVTAGQPAQMLTIEQSGKFFQIAFDHGPLLDLKLTSKSNSSNVMLTNKNVTLYMMDRGNDPDEKMMIQVGGSQPGTWSAHRTVRTFPDDVDAREVK